MAKRRYLFFTREQLPQPAAHLVQVAQCANAAANLGYSTVLAYPRYGTSIQQMSEAVLPQLKTLEKSKLQGFYSIDSTNLSLAELPIPWPQGKTNNRLTHPSTITCKYYWPLHLKSRTSLVHTRDWNFAKAALKSHIPVIFECDHYPTSSFEPEFANHNFLQVVVTVIDTVRESIIRNGIPSEKVLIAPNGFNRYFLERHPNEASEFREKLLQNTYKQLVVYSGALYDFKGVDLILEISQKFPEVRFVFAGGPASQQRVYEEIAQDRHLSNVKFLGFLEQKVLAILLQSANVLAHPHRSGEASTFTSPMKLFDYMASGTPIVATRIDSLRTFESSPAIAKWCKADSPEQFAEALKYVLTRFPYKTGGYEGQLEHVQQFSWENRIKNILERVHPSYIP